MSTASILLFAASAESAAPVADVLRKAGHEITTLTDVAEAIRRVGDFGLVTERTNRRYGTSFTPFEHTEENVSRCFARIEAQNRARAGGKGVAESAVARPSEERARAAVEARARVEALPPELRRALARLYEATVARGAA